MYQRVSSEYIAGFFDGEGSIGIYCSHPKKSGRKYDGYGLRTQLTQNKGPKSTLIMTYLVSKYGGNLSESKTLSNKVCYNWQLNSNSAVKFLRDIKQFLIIKQDQAEIAITWQLSRPARIRNKKGQIVPATPENSIIAIIAMNKLKELKG